VVFVLKKLLEEYIYQNKKIVLGLFCCIVLGIVAGIVIYILSSATIKENLSTQMLESISLSDNGEYIKTDIIYSGIRNNVIYILIMFTFSIMLYGSLFIYLLYILKGLTIGIYISTMFSVFGFWWGLIVILLLVVLVNVVYLPGIMVVGITFINYNLNVMEYRSESGRVVNFSKVILSSCFGLLIIFSSIIVEQLMSNIVIKISGNL
jgi:hypothetical protein